MISPRPAAPARSHLAGILKRSICPIALPALFSLGLMGQTANTFAPIGQGAAQFTTKDEAQIQHLLDDYVMAVNEASPVLASQIWSNSPEVSFIHPLGREQGLDQIKSNVYQRLMGETFSKRQLNIHNPSIHVYGDAAWADFDWDFVATASKTGSAVRTKGRETQIYRKEPAGWRLVHVHYSVMPPTDR